jgi:hypothetical protein
MKAKKDFREKFQNQSFMEAEGVELILMLSAEEIRPTLPTYSMRILGA